MAGYYISTKRTENPSSSGVFVRTPFSTSKSYPRTLDTAWSFRTKRPIGSPTSDVQAMLDTSRIDTFRGPFDTGHPYWVQHSKVSPPNNINAQFKDTGTGSLWWLKGGFYATPTSGSLPINIGGGSGTMGFQDFPGSLEMNAAAQKALAKTFPTNPSANLSQALGELIQDLPKLALDLMSAVTRGLTPRNGLKAVGSDYLNAQFGWAASISDLNKLLQAVVNANKIINDYVKDSGEVLVRHYSDGSLSPNQVVKDVSVRAGSLALSWSPTEGATYGTGGFTKDIRGSVYPTYSYTLQTVNKTWRFAGAWSYLLVKGSTFVDTMARYEQLANKLLGTRITLDVLWELTPWSWLIDWFTHINNFIAINSALQSDSLVLQYGYVTFRTTQHTLCNTVIYDYQGVRHNIQTLYEAQRLERIRATPYGFGIDVKSLTTPQLAILAALGFSRL